MLSFIARLFFCDQPRILSLAFVLMLLAGYWILSPVFDDNARLDDHCFFKDASRIPVTYFYFQTLHYLFRGKLHYYQMTAGILFIISAVYLGKIVYLLSGKGWLGWLAVVVRFLTGILNTNVILVAANYENLCLFFLILCIYASLVGIRKRSILYLSAAIIFLWASYLSKELAIILSIIIPVIIFLHSAASLKDLYMRYFFSLILISSVYLILRLWATAPAGQYGSIHFDLKGFLYKTAVYLSSNLSFFYADKYGDNYVRANYWCILLILFFIAIGTIIILKKRLEGYRTGIMLGALIVISSLIPYFPMSANMMGFTQRLFLSSSGLIIIMVLSLDAILQITERSKANKIIKAVVIGLVIAYLLNRALILRVPSFRIDSPIYRDMAETLYKDSLSLNEDNFFLVLFPAAVKDFMLFDLEQNMNLFYFNDRRDHFRTTQAGFIESLVEKLYGMRYDHWQRFIYLPITQSEESDVSPFISIKDSFQALLDVQNLNILRFLLENPRPNRVKIIVFRPDYLDFCGQRFGEIPAAHEISRLLNTSMSGYSTTELLMTLTNCSEDMSTWRPLYNFMWNLAELSTYE